MVSSRQQLEVVEILRKFKNAETVTRDFSRTYKSAISQALPNAKHIVHRFHILKNLTEDIREYLKHRKIETCLRKWEVINEGQRLKRAGKNNTEIAKILQIARPTVIRYLSMTKPPIDSRPCKLDPYIPRIKELLLRGYGYMEIFNQIKEEGYTVEISLYNSKMKGIHWETKHRVHYLKRSDIKRLLYVAVEEISDGQKRREIEYYLKGPTELEQVLKLVPDFKILLSGKDESELDSWIKRTEILEITEINRFLKLIRSDVEAVKNAIT